MLAPDEFMFASGELAFATGEAAFTSGGMGAGAWAAAVACCVAAACFSAVSFFRLSSIRKIVLNIIDPPYTTMDTTIIPRTISPTVELSMEGK